MNEKELKAFVRDAVRRRLADAGALPDHAESEAPRAHHSSHDVYVTLVNVGEACLIEPSVACNHCNYCKSHGH